MNLQHCPLIGPILLRGRFGGLELCLEWPMRQLSAPHSSFRPWYFCLENIFTLSSWLEQGSTRLCMAWVLQMLPVCRPLLTHHSLANCHPWSSFGVSFTYQVSACHRTCRAPHHCKVPPLPVSAYLLPDPDIVFPSSSDMKDFPSHGQCVLSFVGLLIAAILHASYDYFINIFPTTGLWHEATQSVFLVHCSVPSYQHVD